MIKPKLEILLNGIWTELSYSGDNITIVRKRDDVYKMVIRTSADGDFEFITCEAWNILLPYFNTYNQLESRLTVYSCSGNTVYLGFLTLKNNANFELKICKGSFFIKDKYYKLFDKIDEKYNINNFANVNLNRFLYTSINEPQFISVYSLKFREVILGFLNEIDNTLTFDNVFNEYNLVNKGDWQNAIKLAYFKKPDFYLSLKEIIDFFKDNLFYDFEITNNVFVFVKIKYDMPQNSTLDFTNNETVDSQDIDFDKNKISKYSIQSFDFNSNEMQPFEKYFSTSEIKFNQHEKNEISINQSINTNPYYSNNDKISLFESANYLISEFYYNKLNNNWNNVNGLFLYLYGDFDNLDIHSELRNYDRYIESDSIYIFDDNGSPQIERVEFDFEWATPNSYTTGDLKYVHFNGVEYNVAIGHNVFYPARYFGGWRKVKFRLIANKSIGFATSFAKIKKFNLVINHYRFAKKILDLFINGINTPNGILCNYLQMRDYAANMPESSGTLKLQNNETYNLTNLHTKTDCFKNIKTGYLELIDSYDFGKLVNTKQGWFQIDTIKKSTYNTDFELSKKY